MGKGGNQGEGATEREAPMPTFSWEEIQKHNLRTDQWLVIDRKVYNITTWSNRHPGGRRVIGHYAGEDATVRVRGFPRRHLSLLQAGVGSHGSQGAKPPAMNGAWGARERRKVSTALIPLPPNPRPMRQLGQPAMGVRFWTPGSSAAVEIRAVGNRTGSAARAGTHAFASATGFPRSLGRPKGGARVLGLWRL